MSDEHRELPNMTATEIIEAERKYFASHPVPGDALLYWMIKREMQRIEAAKHVIGSSPAMDALGIEVDED